MKTSTLLKKVRQIEIKTKGLSNHIFAGEYHTAFKGTGMAFSEVREYQSGDDIRSIDWNVTARYNNPFVKVFEEEREMTVMLVIDISKSGNFGTNNQLKRELISEIAAVLSFSAIKNQDKVGVILFTDRVEKFIPPRKGKNHILRIIREILSFQPKNKKTDLKAALEHLNLIMKKRSICFILSDFMTPTFNKPLKTANKRHDLVGLRIYDKREDSLLNMGLVHIKNTETDELLLVDTTSRKTRESFSRKRKKNIEKIENTFHKNGIDLIEMNTEEDYIKPLINFFKTRGRRK
mgnify:CR=1 FL=1